MTEAEKLFNDTVARCFDRWRIILSFRITSREGMAGAMEKIAAQKISFVDGLLRGGEYDKILLDKDAFFRENPSEKLVQQMTEKTIEEAQSAVDAASIIFAHSVLDGAALDYCRVTALVAPNDWELTVGQKQVKLSEIRGTDYAQVLRRKLDELFEQLNRDSLLKKADLLFARCSPPEKWSPMTDYRYDRGRLEKLDRYRHEVIHGASLGKGIPNAEDEVEFLMKTSFFFMGLVNLRYDLKLSPLYLFGVMAGFGKADPAAQKAE